jgi:glycosyltransferase involved in cell wall biosynthesis
MTGPDKNSRSVPRGLLQICPNDKPPFLALCQSYAQAAALIDVPCETLFLDSSFAAPGAVGALTTAPVTTDTERVLGVQPPRYLDQPSGSHRRDGRQVNEARTLPQPALVLCHRYRAYRAARAAGLPGERIVAVAHEFGWMDRWQRRAEFRMGASGVRFAGVSPAVVQELGATTGTALLLPNLVDWAAVEQTALPREAARARLGVEDDRFCIGVVGRLHPKKRPELALDAFRALAQEGRSAELLFIGDGELRETLHKRATGLAAVRFAGFQPDARTLLRGLDCLLMTSSAAEAFGMVALEALTLGVPVAAPRVPGIESVLGELGFYGDADASPASMSRAIMQAMMLTGQPSIRSFRSAARARVRHQFSIAAAARRLRSLLNPP